MSTITQHLNELRQSLPSGVELVAVSKFHPAEAIVEAYEAGQRVFGESRANEFVEKARSLPTDIRWHFIGHLQTNKVRQIIPFVTLIHSVDSLRLLQLIDSESRRINTTTDILLQVHVALEETKFGFSPDELSQLLATTDFAAMTGIRVRGIMGMASNVDDENRIAADFDLIAKCYRQAKASLGSDCDTLSMGMTHDYKIAIAAGANMIRVGSYIFGERTY